MQSSPDRALTTPSRPRPVLTFRVETLPSTDRAAGRSRGATAVRVIEVRSQHPLTDGDLDTVGLAGGGDVHEGHGGRGAVSAASAIAAADGGGARLVGEELDALNAAKSEGKKERKKKNISKQI